MAKKKRQVVITDRNDAHIPFVERHLDKPFIVLDPRELLEGKELTFVLQGDRMVVQYGDDVLDDISGVWYRKPQDIARSDLPVVKHYRHYSQNAMQRHASLLLTAFEDAVWVSDYYALVRASSKTLQLAVAKQIGFNVPDTVVTSSTETAKQFLAKHEVAITKPLSISHPKINGEQKILLTTLIDKDFMPDLSNLYLAPSIFQAAIDVAYDVRVTVVDTQVFAAIVKSNKEGEDSVWARVRDSRVGHYDDHGISIEALDMPKEIADLCVAHNKALGLRYGAIDLVIDKKGKYWFLENNPNGQWAYIEDVTGQPIGKALADLLQSA